MKTSEVNPNNMGNMVIEKALDDDVNPAIIAIEYDLPVGSKDLWWPPQEFAPEGDVYQENIDLLGAHDDVLTNFVRSIAKVIQFPKSTAMLHGLGCVSAAMTERFFYTFNQDEKKTCSLYTVGAQPPSTGKSAINGLLTADALQAYEQKKAENLLERKKVLRRIACLKKEMDKAPVNQAVQMEEDMIDLENQLEGFPAYKFMLNDPTPEGCERVLSEQGGFFNVISDESAAVGVILGNVYGSAGQAKNNGVFLKAWDNGYLSVARGGRDGYCGSIRGAVAVLAQDASITAILTAGLQGEGVSERFLMIKEPQILGDRDHFNVEMIDQGAKFKYGEMMRAVAREDREISLTFSAGAKKIIKELQQEQEPLMRVGGKYSSTLMQGTVGKNQIQICKLSCVLHTIENWSGDKNKSTEVDVTTVVRAISIFGQLLKTYTAAADSKGFTGRATELGECAKKISSWAQKGKKSITKRVLRDGLKNAGPFKSCEHLTRKLNDELMPILQDAAYVVWDDAKAVYHINPRLKE